jgi:hypothetical protein
MSYVTVSDALYNDAAAILKDDDVMKLGNGHRLDVIFL